MNAPVSRPFACVLDERRYVLSETDHTSVPRILFRVICECARRLLVHKTPDGEELTRVLEIPEKFSRKVSPGIGLQKALPALM